MRRAEKHLLLFDYAGPWRYNPGYGPRLNSLLYRNDLNRLAENVAQTGVHVSDYCSTYLPAYLNAEETFQLLDLKRNQLARMDPKIRPPLPFTFSLECTLDRLKTSNAVRLWDRANYRRRNLPSKTVLSYAIPEHVEWITENPGRQLTGSFHPESYDWYCNAFGMPTTVASG